MQPGDTITPGGAPPDPAVEVPEPTPPLAPAAPQPEPEQPDVPAAPPTPIENQSSNVAQPSIETVSWTASEFVEHQKPQGWYVLLGLGAVVISAVLYFISKDVITVVVVALATVMFGVVGARKPRSLSYAIGPTGVKIGEKSFPYETFKSFSVIEEGAIDSIQLAPLKRFVPPISLYFPPDQEEEIVETLAAYLPHEDRNHDAVDRLMKRVHF